MVEGYKRSIPVMLCYIEIGSVVFDKKIFKVLYVDI